MTNGDTQTVEIFLNVLGYREEDEWVALVLEMDLRGYGETFEEALKEVVELVEMQVSFAAYKGQPEMLWKPADPIWLERFAEVRQTRLRDLYSGSEPASESGGYKVRGVPIPPPHVIAGLSEFSLANA